MCRPDQKRIYGVARNEAAEILCEVDAFPPPDVFKWSFNNTAEMIDMPSTDFVKQSLRASKLTYTPTKVRYENVIVELIATYFTFIQTDASLNVIFLRSVL